MTLGRNPAWMIVNKIVIESKRERERVCVDSAQIKRYAILVSEKSGEEGL